MDLVIIILLVVVFFTLIYLIYKTSSSKSSIEATDLLNFSNSLNTQIQDIRKEIDSNSRESRGEIEKKLNNINKQINDYHQSSSVSITQQFKESNKVIKDVTTELEKKFKADIKNRIDETSKYIRPNEKTTDYAYMFIPADGLLLCYTMAIPFFGYSIVGDLFFGFLFKVSFQEISKKLIINKGV